MKPCDCKDNYDVNTKLNESGVSWNGIGIRVAPSTVVIYTDSFSFRLPQHIFKRFSEWYLEDQKKENDNG